MAFDRLISARIYDPGASCELPQISFEVSKVLGRAWTFLIGDVVPRRTLRIHDGEWRSLSERPQPVSLDAHDGWAPTTIRSKMLRELPAEVRNSAELMSLMAGVDTLLAETPERVLMLMSPESYLGYSERQQVVPVLQKLYPRTQFIVTTNDPVILSCARREQVRMVFTDRVEPCPIDPRLATIAGIAGLLGAQSVYPNELGDLLARWHLSAHNPYRTDEEDMKLGKIEAALRKAGIRKNLGLSRSARISQGGR